MSAESSHDTVPREQSQSNSRSTDLDEAGTKPPVYLIFNQNQERSDSIDSLRLDWSPAVWDTSSYGSGKETPKGHGLPVVELYQESGSSAKARDRKDIRDIGSILLEPSECIMYEKMMLDRTQDSKNYP